MRKQGFTLIEMMIVIAIIAIIAAIAIPNIISSGVRANEANAITRIKQYGTAQISFQNGKLGRLVTNSKHGGRMGFADNYRNLHYGNPIGEEGEADDTQNLFLIDEIFADAYFADNYKSGAATVAKPMAPNNAAKVQDRANHHYVFAEPADMPVEDFATTYALVAIPTKVSSKGALIYYTDQRGTVLLQGTATPSTPPTVTPYTNRKDWHVVK